MTKTALVQLVDDWFARVDTAARHGDIKELDWLRISATRQASKAAGIADRETWRGIAAYAEEAIHEVEDGLEVGE